MNDCLLCMYIYILFFLLCISTFSVTSISKLYIWTLLGACFCYDVISMVILLIFEYKLVPGRFLWLLKNIRSWQYISVPNVICNDNVVLKPLLALLLLRILMLYFNLHLFLRLFFTNLYFVAL